ncbi:hypothetical protein ARMSODRAFT_1083737 [Armillaria solidipes]|uniref:F-box domain-containing protein n=1 Tax=Armillaria solidipes TaxID=1076256 RepID=A0A2H3BP51_9AGAR|nr:hypothetical protein ARMSODRAFT_1083737 [Armillaria solidipes]
MSCRNCGFVPEPQLQNLNTESSDSLVSQILCGSRPLLDSDHALLNADIVELEQLQSLYDTQLEEIQLRRCAVLTALESRKSIYAPIHRLPRDILIEIFDSVCDSWWEEADDVCLDVSGPLWVLGRVCGLWRDTLHSSPASWAQKLVMQDPFSKDALEILQTYLEHTGEHLLNLQILCGDSAGDHEILSLLVQSCQRWKNLRICASQFNMPHLESISQFPALQTIDIRIHDVYGSDYHSDVCLGAPQLWRASIRGQIKQIKLPPGITHFTGCITCPEDLHLLSKLPNLRWCHLWTNLASKEAPVVTMSQLTHLYAKDMGILDVLCAPLLSSLTFIAQGSQPLSTQESITRFLHRSRCHLESLSVSKAIFTSATPSRVFALEACSTISRLKVELPPWTTSSVVEALSSPSVLPNLHHLILCIPQDPEDGWETILHVVRSRRDAGLLKLVEVQFGEEGFEYFYAADIWALTEDDFEMRFEKWDPPRQDHLYLWHLS